MTSRSAPGSLTSVGAWLLALLAAVGLLVLGTGTASAHTLPDGGNRVRACAPETITAVGVSEHIAAGQGRGPPLSRPRFVVATGVAANTAIRVRPPLSIPKGQFGAKWGKHAMDYGLDPGDAAARAGFMSRIRNVHLNPDEVRLGKFRDYDEAFMFRQGEDLLITRTDGTFVSMYPGASTSSWFKNAEVFPH